MPELTRRYVVMAMAAEAPFDPGDPEAPFVLKPWKDPAALHALIAYRDRCYPELSRDLTEWIRMIEAGPVVRGDVGRRNEAHARTAAPTTAAPAKRARTRRRRPAEGKTARARHGGKRASTHRKKRRR
jgi:hypothetical protein